MNILNRVTLKTMAKNRVRTVVTVIGIILSAAMMTAVTTSIASLQQFMVRLVRAETGDWHGAAYGCEASDVERIRTEKGVSALGVIRRVGYAPLETVEKQTKPYLFIGAIDEGTEDVLPIHITDGRLPENGQELILPKHLRTTGKIRHAIGDRLTLSPGGRLLDGVALGQQDLLQAGETLSAGVERTYTVVGFYKQPDFEHRNAAGYTALTRSTAADDVEPVDLYIQMKHPSAIHSLLQTQFSNVQTRTNNDLLRMTGSSRDASYNAVLRNMGAILIAIIVFGSISLIYNAFSISVNERTKQFGLLASIGATRAQLRRTVYAEAGTVALIGIPLGLLSGLVGIGLTLHFTGRLFSMFIAVGGTEALTLVISPEALAIAAVIALMTVFISAYLPARRALKMPAIEAIRQSADVAIRARQVKTSRLTYWLFGFEGMLASKNFKRNRKKYRATVLSLFLSVVLFISASSFCDYMRNGTEMVAEQPDYDIQLTFPVKSFDQQALNKISETLTAIPEITSSVHYIKVSYPRLNEVLTAPSDALSAEAAQFLRPDGADAVTLSMNVCYIEDAVYQAYVKQLGLNESRFTGGSAECIAVDDMSFYDTTIQKYRSVRIFDAKRVNAERETVRNMPGYTFIGRETENGEDLYLYESNGEARNVMKLHKGEAVISTSPLTIGAVTQDAPGFLANAAALILPLSAYQPKASADDPGQAVFCFHADDYRAAADAVWEAADEMNLPERKIQNAAENTAVMRALMTVVDVFSYGFIVLISLIALANVFNTISTNIALRRREFAMLRSIGMTHRGFRRMMNYECILYGLKGLIFGVPVACGVTYLIFRALSGGVVLHFYIPWYSIAIAVGSVFAVVFATMLYAMRKVSRGSTIEAIRCENI